MSRELKHKASIEIDELLRKSMQVAIERGCFPGIARSITAFPYQESAAAKDATLRAHLNIMNGVRPLWHGHIGTFSLERDEIDEFVRECYPDTGYPRHAR